MKNPADTEDAVQDTFYQLIRKGPPFESEEHEKAWLIRTAANLCKNALRHWWRKRRSLEDYGALQKNDSARMSDKIIDAWNKIEPDRDADRRMLSATLARNRLETKRRERALAMRMNSGWKLPASVAACLVLVVAIAIPLFTGGGNGFDLGRSSGVKVDYADDPPPIIQKPSLAEALTEKELFADKYRGYELVAFEGTIVETRNIVCDYNGFKDYRAIAMIEVQGVLRGEIKQGTTVTVLLPGPVDVEGLWVEDTGVSSQMKAGTRGIFMPIQYDERSIREENGNRLALLDLAAYGFLDGERWAFLETAAGLVYNHDSYPSLVGAKNLEEIKGSILPKLK